MPDTITPTESARQASDAALCRSVVFGVLSMGLCEPSEALVERLRSEETRRVLAEAARHLHLAARAEVLAERLAGLDLETQRLQHGRLFGHTVHGPVCPYESEYGQEAMFQQSHHLGDLIGLYAAFGLVPATAAHERADHVSCELEFLEFLSRKEAYAIEAGDADMLEETRKAARLFFKEHVARFGRAFARALADKDPGGFHGGLAELLYDFVTLECARLGVEPGPAVLRLREWREDDAPMQCGTSCGLAPGAACGPEENL
jgi:TorA maturation chaperone TorD